MLVVMDLVCPRCGTGNAPNQLHISLERGVAVCDGCGHSGPVVTFQPDSKEKR